jgi:two-component system sensor histidine kinase KdpD
MVHVDGVQIAQVCWNVLVNALKYAPERTPVEISARLQPAAPETSCLEMVQVSVTDQGPGVPLEEQELVFESFYRSRRKRSGSDVPETPGSGLGLAICRALVEAHGGRIWVENASGGGATFHFTLPEADVDGLVP